MLPPTKLGLCHSFAKVISSILVELASRLFQLSHSRTRVYPFRAESVTAFLVAEVVTIQPYPSFFSP